MPSVKCHPSHSHRSRTLLGPSSFLPHPTRGESEFRRTKDQTGCPSQRFALVSEGTDFGHISDSLPRFLVLFDPGSVSIRC